MVDAGDVTGAGTNQRGDGHARTEADLQHVIGWARAEQRDRPEAALPVGRAVSHLPGGHVTGGAAGLVGLADHVTVQRAHDGEPGPRHPVLHGRGQRPPRDPWHASVMSSSHVRQPTPSSAPEVNSLLTIGQLARRTGVTASALRYYEELGLLPAPARASGQRRYPESAARVVGTILLYSDAGFTLAEQKALMATSAAGEWGRLARRKLAELDDQIARAQAARRAIEHGLRCPHEDITRCPNFNAGIDARLAGEPLSRSHERLHDNDSAG